MDAVDKEQIRGETTACNGEQENTGRQDEQTEVNGVQTEDAEGNHELSARAIQHVFGLSRGARPLPNDDFTLPQSFIDERSSTIDSARK
ncbi:hypothetical protein GN958_ATG04614 [Phytophthora infestans]|uniref:Uncharacterized protein n=1 Tax=Phytophthora infestans TaxID=4787 RepID=A0A8S9V4L4_PHYIN|nr:hypothetical protein GN958_ATG04614 [Phytophthora infestans]